MVAKSENWMPLPLGRMFSALLRTLPALLAFAIVSAGLLAGLFVLLFKYSLPIAVWLLLLGLLALSHAAYLVFASRIVARACRLETRKLTVSGWLRAVFAVLVLVIAAGFMIKAFTMILLPSHSDFAAFISTAALVAWTPVLPMIAAEGRSVGSALGNSAPDLFRFLFSGLVTSLPFFIPLGFVVLRLFSCEGCWGLFEGGVVTFPILGASIFAAVTAMALVSTVVYAAMKPTMEFAEG